MADRAFEDLLSRVLHYVPGCSEYLAIDEIRRTAKKFFRDTMLWQHCDEIWTKAGVCDYQIRIPSKALIGHIESVTYLGSPLNPTNELTLNDKGTNWRDRTAQQPFSYLSPSPGYLKFTPIPEESVKAAVKVYCRIYPSDESTGMDETLFNRWEEAIVHGTLATLLAIPNQRFTNTDQAAYRMTEYRDEEFQGKAEYRQSGTRSGLRVKQRPMA